MLRAVVGLILVLYPLGVYLLVDRVSPALLVGLLGILFVARLFAVQAIAGKYLGLACLGVALFCYGAYVEPEMRVLKMYPVLINLGAAAFGVYTLFTPPSAIERISRKLRMAIVGSAIPYMRRLTMVWIVFFVVNGSLAAYTALASTIGVWAFYNGFLSYVFIALLLGLEYPVRLVYRKRHGVVG